MRLLYLIIIFTLLNLPAFSQSRFAKGYIVLPGGDTTRGYINYKEWHNSPVEIEFKTDNDAKETIYNSTQINYFEIDDKLAYSSFAGYITDDTDKLNDIAVIDTSTIYKTIFLEVLRKGKTASLLYYGDNKKKRYFIKDEISGITEELVQYSYMSNDGLHVNTLKRYKKKLYDFASKRNVLTKKLQSKIDNSNYNDYDFISIFADINNVDAKAMLVRVHKKGYRFFVGASVNIASVKFIGNNELASDVTSKGSVYPAISAGVDFYSNADIQNFIFRIELSATKNKHVVKSNPTYGYFIDYEATTLSVLPQILYNLKNEENLKVYVGAGVGFSNFFYKRIYYARKYGDGLIPQRQIFLTTYAIDVPLSAGVMLNKKIELNVLVNFLGSGIKQNTNITTFIQPGIKYLFK